MGCTWAQKEKENNEWRNQGKNRWTWFVPFPRGAFFTNALLMMIHSVVHLFLLSPHLLILNPSTLTRLVNTNDWLHFALSHSLQSPPRQSYVYSRYAQKFQTLPASTILLLLFSPLLLHRERSYHHTPCTTRSLQTSYKVGKVCLFLSGGESMWPRLGESGESWKSPKMRLGWGWDAKWVRLCDGEFPLHALLGRLPGCTSWVWLAPTCVNLWRVFPAKGDE